MSTLYHQVFLNTTKEKLFDAIATAEAITKWWEPHEATITADGTVLSHDPGEAHGIVRQKIVDLVPNERIEWECVSSGHPATSPASAWPGTHVIWEISEQKNRPAMSGFGTESDQMTVLDFRHSGWDESSPYFAFCNFAWGCVLQMLKEHCEGEE